MPPPTIDLGRVDAEADQPAPVTCVPDFDEAYCYSAFKATVLLCHCDEGKSWDACKREWAPSASYRSAYLALIDCLAKNCDRPCMGDLTAAKELFGDCSQLHCRAELSCCRGQ
ncbi:MAG: hypothetical protein JRH20_31710 [Deltaproteobacteria bacterium]|nr:hypothetical protein [Deltaproteobacteria bacterium]